MSTSSHKQGSLRWMAPELLDSEQTGLQHSHPSPASDIYSLSMVMWEVFSGRVPFSEYQLEAQVIRKVLQGQRPERPDKGTVPDLSHNIWSIMEACWYSDWRRRPHIAVIVRDLQRLMKASEMAITSDTMTLESTRASTISDGAIDIASSHLADVLDEHKQLPDANARYSTRRWPIALTEPTDIMLNSRSYDDNPPVVKLIAQASQPIRAIVNSQIIHGSHGGAGLPGVMQLAASFSSPHEGPLVPQLPYYRPSTDSQSHNLDEVELQEPIMFYTRNPQRCGIGLRDALNSRNARLLGRDDYVFHDHEKPHLPP
ncbi:hypothetical protein AcV5_000176 [Taiwanofungus camphoratus]|nr:hypothetical protein AcV5_000176 [Antrodia cinnamomea]